MNFSDLIKDSTQEFQSQNDRDQTPRPSISPYKHYNRPTPNSPADSLIFQQFEIDHYIGNANPSFCTRVMAGSVPVLRIYGSTTAGDSVCAHIHGFYPYFYVLVPDDFEDSHTFKSSLNSQVMKQVKNPKDHEFGVLEAQIELKQSIFGYRGDVKSKFLRVTFTNIRHAHAGRRVLEERGMQIFESDIQFEIRFMVDVGMTGCCWCELEGFRVRRGEECSSRCSIEVDLHYGGILAHNAEGGRWEDIAPVRILSFDIECSGRRGIFPQPTVDPVIQIANVLKSYNSGEESEVSVIFTLLTCAPIVGATVICFETEEQLLSNWSMFVRAYDPDLITGYNIENFDLNYLITRAETLKLTAFPYLGRLKQAKSVVRDSTFESKQMGRHDHKLVNLEGRVVLDVYWVLMRNHKLRSYTLNSVSSHFLGEQKGDVKYSIIAELQMGDDQTRRRLAIYCLKDAQLPLRLMGKLMLLVNHVEMARVTGVPLLNLLRGGQQVKVISQLYRKCRECGVLIPSLKGGTAGEEFEGATVIEPTRGFYTTPIATLDFTSLYPSIMIAHNLCYSTLVRGTEWREDSEVSPSGSRFVRATVRRGILPVILEDLLSARKRAKRELAQEKDEFRRRILDGRQLALKISANSVYGFTGAQNGKLPCLEISQSVTAYGREMIEFTRREVQAEFTRDRGYDFDADVIYGDTDSVMVSFGGIGLRETMEMAFKAASLVSSKFPAPINLDFEKVYFPYLLISKKRYAGVVFPSGMYSPERTEYRSEKIDCKGIENVRRDNCPLVANLISNCLRLLLLHRDSDSAVAHVQRTVADLLSNQVDISHLVISRELTRNQEDYSGKQAHVELAARMKKRDPGTAPKLGDRVPYVIVASGKGTAAYLKSEDPLYVLENNIPIDTDYYLNNQIRKPLVRIFEPILGARAESVLFAGDHANQKKIVTTKVGGLMGFVKKSSTCMKCRTLIGAGDNRALCPKCEGLRGEMCAGSVGRMRALEEKFSRLWVRCQRCQGSFHDEVICSNRDCPIFYMRVKARKDLKEASDLVDRFDW